MTIKVQALWGMSRPLIMLSVVMVYVNGLIIALARGHEWQGAAVGWHLGVLLLVSLSIHYVNEYADVETDALTRPTRYSGGSGVLPSGTVSPRLAMKAAWVTLVIGVGLGIFGLYAGWMSWAGFGLLLGGAFGGWMYSLPPLKLAWHGFGEATNAILGGVFLHLYGYAVLGQAIDVFVLVAVVPFTLLTFNNLLATTWADRWADQQVGKFTLATQMQPQRLRALYLGVVLVALGMLPLLALWQLPLSVLVGSFLALPMVFWGWRTYTRQHEPYPTSNAMVVFIFGQMGGWLVTLF